MRVGTYKKILFSMLCATALLALCVYLLPIDTLVVGYSSKNGIGGPTFLPKLEGLAVVCMMPLTALAFWIHRNTAVLKKDNHKVKLEARSVLYLFISFSGVLLLLINLARYLISII